MKIFRSISCLCLIWGLLVCLTGCPQTTDTTEPRGMAYYSYFDTVSYIYSYAGDSDELFSARTEAAADILGEYHRLFDIYHEYSGTVNLCTLNKNAGGEALKVDRKLIDFLLYARELYELTGGEMNVMMGSVLILWHDCRTAASSDPSKASIPSPELLNDAAKHVSFSSLEINEDECTVRISDAKARIDVGALGKGYATEMAARKLESIGAVSYVLNIGGNIRIVGSKPDSTGWRTGIKDPLDPDTYAEYLDLANTSCVTSGIYERFFTVGGVQYHHIIDKDTLMPSEHFASVSVITKNSGLADALSTALFTMSYEDGLALVTSIGEVDVLWVTHDGEKLMTDGMKALITEQQ